MIDLLLSFRGKSAWSKASERSIIDGAWSDSLYSMDGIHLARGAPMFLWALERWWIYLSIGNQKSHSTLNPYASFEYLLKYR